jgi:hypothetical protein
LHIGARVEGRSAEKEMLQPHHQQCGMLQISNQSLDFVLVVHVNPRTTIMVSVGREEFVVGEDLENGELQWRS